MNKEKIYGFIPARNGSKRLHNKNIKLINGKSLVEYAIDASLKSRYINETVVSTDNPLIKRIAERKNVRCIDRKKELCMDYTSTQEVINDFIHSLISSSFNDLTASAYTESDCTVLLQPTSPLRTAGDIDNGIRMFMDNAFDSVVSVNEVAPFMYYPNGAVFVFKHNVYTDNMGFFLMPKKRSVDVDTDFDFQICEQIMAGLMK